MAVENYYVILTRLGAAKHATAIATGGNISLTEMAVGSGQNDTLYEPVDTQTALKTEVWRGGIGAIRTDPDNNTRIIIETNIPQNVGGFVIREFGIFDSDGDLFAVGKYPPTTKTSLAQGAPTDQLIRAILAVNNINSITLLIDPAIIMASKKYVDDLILPLATKSYVDAAIKIPVVDMAFLAGIANNGSNVDLSVQRIGALRLARNTLIQNVIAVVATAPTGDPVEIDITKNGTSIFTTKPTIPVGTNLLSGGVLDPAQLACVAGDLIEPLVTQVGSVIRGQGLTLSIKAIAQ
ncbi:phage tail protein [Kiloniella laminariae]|uniref:Phage tail protein n=1 Tax=Kiloniella laminariae TaxID=454162 RepID=A0ABT4LKU5_9PROT|nr:phage tail protein [Kiloniella laminariae]MCZ4281699.1 phage tail protein [Kiloniella laminariae]